MHGTGSIQRRVAQRWGGGVTGLDGGLTTDVGRGAESIQSRPQHQ